MLNDDEVESVKLLMSLNGWTQVMRPRIENRLRGKIKSLMMFPHERPTGEAEDAALRGAIAELEWMLVAWQNEIAVHAANRHADELRAQELNEANGTPAPYGQAG